MAENLPDLQLDPERGAESCCASQLPLVMQSSNRPPEDGLDIGHDGGGDRTSSANPISDRDSLSQLQLDPERGAESCCAASQPPLIMQSSNHPPEDGLDIGHDGGGDRTSDADPNTNYISHDHDYHLAGEIASDSGLLVGGVDPVSSDQLCQEETVAEDDQEPQKKRLKVAHDDLRGGTCLGENSLEEGEFTSRPCSENSNEGNFKECKISDATVKYVCSSFLFFSFSFSLL